ncbi:hypothetical protein [Pseudorhodoferax sp. Leaf267]|uniref:hypothetical protein n=1 Tax=Pseudorhodoferax sp. Leaf267 TaxID=1736316 RepID=UPI0006F7BD5C|nr:hypothetical protein [Pseudorhodoferax sp. Leaf267]KQP14122.1 hypothetical protein ASF43_14885 [Pseudorhodoferax sp. Leaf267]
MTTIQARRQLIVILLLCVAAVAAVIRHYAERGSTVHNVSTVMMLLWLPVVGSIVGWFYARLQRKPPAAPPSFAPGRAFEPQALVELTLRPASIPAEDGPVAIGEHRFVLVVGHQGFQSRWQVAPGEVVRRGQTHQLHVEFLTPQTALPQLPQGTPFRMLVGDAFTGDGRVLQVLAPAA